MAKYVLSCRCGNTMSVPRLPEGFELRCTGCGQSLHVTRTNLTRVTDEPPETKAKPDVAPFLAEEEKAAKSAEEAPPAPPGPEAQPLSEHERQAQADVALFFADEEEAPKATAAAAPPRPQSVVPPPPPPRPPPVVDQCARCKRKFRGDWDRVDAFDGVVCHICANKADSMMPGEAPVRSIPKTNPLQREIMRQASWSIPGEQAAQEKLSEEQKRARNRQMLILAAVAVVVTAIVVFWPTSENPQSAPPSTPAIDMSAPNEPPPGQFGLLIKIVDILTRIGVQIVAVYVTLAIMNRLPNDGFLPNLVSIAPVAVLLTIASVLLGFTAVILGFVAGLLSLGLCIFIVDLFFDLSLSGMLLYAVVSVMAGFMMAAVETMVLGILGLTLT